MEGGLVRAVGSHRLNPLPHTGTISIFLLMVVTVTGLYLMLFFSFGFDASYDAIARMEAHPVQRVVRAVHRYASAGLVLTTLTHGWRTLVAGRFTGPRWWPWATGSFSLLVVWIAGVTGYWLIWDERAAVLNDALGRFFANSSRGVDFLIDFLVGPYVGSGWLVLLLLLTIHVGATVVIGVAVWYHIRRSRTAFLPPRFWIGSIGGVLVALAVVAPAGVLSPADPTQLPGRVPVDPFYLFLLPPLQIWSPWVVVLVGGLIGAVATALPLATRRVEPVLVDESACTGCELCVHDCPYGAMAMRGEGADTVVVVDEKQCVACGICIGSCSFGALTLDNMTAPLEAPAVDAGEVTVACRRHVQAGAGGWDGQELIEVECLGMLHPRIVASLTDQGAEDIHIVGCAPADCSFGIGNTVLHERLAGERSPMLGRRWRGVATEDWVTTGAIEAALADPGRHPVVDASRPPLDSRHAVAALILVGVTFAAVVALTNIDFGAAPDTAAIDVIVDHVPGNRISIAAAPTGSPGLEPRLAVEIDGTPVLDRSIPLVAADHDGTALAYERLEVAAGSRRVTATLIEGGDETVLYDGTMTLQPGAVVSLNGVDAPPSASVTAGRALFTEASLGSNAGCSICHSLGDEVKVGPPLGNIGVIAESRVPGVSAEDYLRDSILEPDAYIVDGYPGGQMVPDYERRLSTQEINALVAFMLSLKEGA